MAKFELFVPASTPDGFNITATVEAESWTAALRDGLSKLGDASNISNLMVDIREDGIHVTEPLSARVFRIRELEASPVTPAAPAVVTPIVPPPVAPPAAAPIASAPLPAPAVSAAPPPAAPPPAVVPAAAPPPVQAQPAPLPTPVVPAAPAPVVAAAPPPAAAPIASAPASVASAAPPSSVDVTSSVPAAAAPAPQIGRAEAESWDVEDLITDLMMETQDIYNCSDLRQAADFILALAQRTIACDSGAVFIADINRQDLFFAAASGPKADAVMSFRVPMGQGLVGFSAQEGVSVGISDAHRDPRFYKAISEKLGYETRSILCSPAQKDGRVYGALELINKNTGSSFTGREMSVLNFLATEFADYLINTNQTGQ